MQQATSEKHWYLVQCKPRQDFRALEHLKHQGYECLLPTHQIGRLRNGQWQHQDEPLFPGYLFIELDTNQDNWMPIRSTRGVNQIVRFGHYPVPVPRHIVEQLKSRSTPTKQKLESGEKIIIDWDVCGEFEAIFVSKDGAKRVLILMTFLQREIQISVPTTALTRAS